MESFLRTILLFTGIFLGSYAFANVNGNITHLFNPASGEDDLLSVETSQILPPHRFYLGFFVDSAQNVLPGGTDALGRVYESRDSLQTATWNIGYGLSDNLELGLQSSYLFMQSSQRPAEAPQFSATGFEDIRTNLKVRLLERKPLGIALIAGLNFSRIKKNPYQGMQNDSVPSLEIVTDASLGENLIALNIGYLWRANKTAVAGSSIQPYSTQALASLGLSRKWNEKLSWSAEVYAASTSPEGNANFTGEALAGFKYRMDDKLSFEGGAAAGNSAGLFAADSRFYAGFRWAFDFAPPPSPPTEFVPPPAVDESKIFVIENMLATVLFDYGSSKIRPREERKLQAMIEIFNGNPDGTELKLIGRADARGTDEANQIISQKRAAAVKSFVESHGLHPGISVEVVSYGASQPLASNLTQLGRDLNRQVGIFIVPRTQP